MPERKDQKKLRRILEGLDKGWLKYESRKRAKIDFRVYTEAQISEIENMLKLVKEIIDEAVCYVPYDPKPGKQPKDFGDKAKAILVQQYFQCSNRVAAGLVRLFRKNLGVSEYLSYKDIERSYGNVEVMLILHKAFELCNRPLKDKEKNFSIDGTGLTTSIRENYARDKENKKAKRMWEKAITVIGHKYKMLSAARIVDGKANESPFLVPLLNETMKIYVELGIFTGDAAYLSRDNCDAIVAYGGTPRIYPKSNTVINQKGSKAWKNMLTELVEDYQKWLSEYHIRSDAESGNSVLKRIFTRPLLKKLDPRKNLEGFARLCAYNMRRLNYIHALHDDVKIPWL